jgi:predicted aspartyl protease
MIRGVVTPEKEAVIRLQVHGVEGVAEEIEAIIDTGFNDFLTLAPQTVAGRGLPYAALAQAKLADGSIVEAHYYRARVVWDGVLRDILALAMEGGSLVDMSLLYGHDLYVQVAEGGVVTIQASD